jgi:hypothetical protein
MKDKINRVIKKREGFRPFAPMVTADDANKYFEDIKELIKGYGFTSRADAELKRINAEIRRVGELPGEKMAPEAKRDRINELQGIKNRVLKGVIDQRIKAGMNKYPWED